MNGHIDSLIIIDTLRRLNRTFVHERDIKKLLSALCDTIVSIPQFTSVWIAILKRNKELEFFEQKGNGEYGDLLKELLSSKGLNYCAQLAIENEGPFFVEKNSSTCNDCPLLLDNKNNKSLTLPVYFQNNLLGVVSISVAVDHQLSDNERELLVEFCEYLGNSLNTIRLENNRKKINETISSLSTSITGNTSDEVISSFILNLVNSFDADYAFIGRLIPGFDDRIKTIRVATPDGIIENFEYTLKGTPCQEVINIDMCCYPENVAELFPKDNLLREMGIQAYIGSPLFNSQKEPFAILVVLKKTPFESESLTRSIFQIFVARAASELIRYDTEQCILESEHQYQELIETSKNPIYIIVGTNYALVNNAWLQMFEYTRDEVLSPDFSVDRIVTAESQALILRRLENFLSGVSQPYQYELQAISKSGKKFDLDVSVTHLNWQGKMAVQGVYRNITEVKRTERKLIKELTDSRETLKRKTAFLHNLSQEILTNLNNINSKAEINLNLNPGNNEDRDFAKYVIDQSKELLEHANDILDISRIEMGQLKLNPEKFNLSDLLKEVLHSFLPIASSKGIQLNCCAKKINSVTIVADQQRVRQILANIISNAIKYTEKGEIHINYEARVDDVRISISDTGRGIEPEMQKNIYKSFVKPNTTLSGEYDGSGLGLAVTRSLIQLMNGKIWVESNSHGGSIFYFTIPLI